MTKPTDSILKSTNDAVWPQPPVGIKHPVLGAITSRSVAGNHEIVSGKISQAIHPAVLVIGIER